METFPSGSNSDHNDLWRSIFNYDTDPYKDKTKPKPKSREKTYLLF